MINPAGIPTIPGDMDALAGHAAALGGVGTDFADTGARVNATWQGLGGVYAAPEVAQLLAATAPVQTLSASVGHDISTVATALSAYAAEVREINTQLTGLRSQASTFVAENGGSDDWHSDDAKVEHNKSLVAGVDAQLAAFYEAQRRCANAINALYGGPQYTADNGDGQHQPGEYGYTADQLNAAARTNGALPWGSVHERDHGLLGDIGAFCGGIKDGAAGLVTGLGALIGRDPTTGGWSWATAGTAWQGLGTFALAVGVYAVPGGMQLDQAIGIPGFDRGAMGDTLLTAGKSIIAYEQWGTDPARAAGMATFAIVSAVVATKGATAGLHTAGAAATGCRVAAVSTTGTAMVRTSEAIGRMPTVSELAGRATARLPGLHLPNLSNATHLTIAHHVDIPTPRTYVNVPTGTPPHPGTVGDALSHTPAGHLEASSIHHADIPGPRAADTAPAPAPAHVHGHADSPTELRPHADLQPHTGADHPLSSHDPSPVSHTTADDHVPDAHSHELPDDQPADPGAGDPIHTTPGDTTDWSAILGTTDVNTQPAIHSGTATVEQAQHYIAKNHPYALDVNTDRYERGVPGSDQNCSRCVYAVDNGFANGAPTSALPWPEGPGWGLTDNTFDDYARMLGAHPTDLRAVSSYDDIIKDMTARGEGARGMVYLSRPGPPPSAHVFNVVHDQHGVVFLDGQNGALGILEKNVDIAYLPIGG
jgi:hypothetical protein